MRPPTATERAWMDREMRETKRVLPNKLAIERLNRERQTKGLQSLNVPVVPLGEEALSSVAPGSSAQAAPALVDSSVASTSAGTVGLAASVDNSTLTSFPPVRNQGTIGSCASFATGYYTATHMLSLARNLDARGNSDDASKISPKWLYSLVNDGEDSGSWFTSNIDVLLKLGAPSWQLFPYNGNRNNSQNYLEWSRDASVWRAAVSNRFREAGRVTAVDTQAGLNNLKALLANGYLLLFGTDVFGWQSTTFSNDPATSADNALAGRQVCWKVVQNLSGHAMTIVGYNDDVWTDINRNGVVDSGEKGALKIVNSWGTDWGDNGFTWIAYDALRGVSAVTGADNFNRASGYRAPFWGNEVYWVTARPSYTPRLLAEFTLSHASRSQLYLRVGSSGAGSSSPSDFFPVPSSYDWQNSNWGLVFRNLGGSYAFDGNFAAIDGNFVLDLTDIIREGAARYYLVVSDNASGSPCSVKSLRLTSPSGQTLATATAGLPATADAGTAQVQVDFTSQASSAPVITSATTASATVGQAFNFQVAASNSPSSYSASGLPPGLAINAASGAITGTPTQAGTFAAAVSASNASGTGSAVLTITVTASFQAVPQITSPGTASGAIGNAFSYSIVASGSPTSYGASSLPPGLTINSATGVVSGAPTQAGVYEMTVTASNAAGTGSKKVAVTVAQGSAAAPVITSPDTATGTSGSSFTYRIEATNAPNSFGAEGLPDTLSLNASTGVISGVLPGARTYFISLRASNSSGSGYRTLALTVTGDALVGPPNDAFANATVASGAQTTAQGGNNLATIESGEPSHAGQSSHSVWWSWTAPQSASVTISTAGSSFDTVLAVYTGSSFQSLTKVAENDDSGGRTSLVQFSASAGSTYMIAVDGYGTATGSINLSIQQQAGTGPANDFFANRSALSGSSASVSASNTGATPQDGEPAHAGFTAAKSVWWSWTAPASGRVTLDTRGSSFDTLLAVYTGGDLSQLVTVASDDQSGGNNTSLLRFTAVQGATYQIAIDGWLGDQGGAVLNLVLEEVTGPPNDNFALAAELTGGSGGATGANRGATSEGGEPAHVGYSASRSVWWKWTAPSAGSVRFNTDGSSFDTVLGAYVGNSVSSLTRLASDDDSGAGRASAVEFSVSAGTTYYFAVDGYAGAAGDISVNFSYAGAPANDNFAAAAVLADSSADAFAANENATRETSEPAHALSTASRSLWWKWTPERSATVTVSTAGSNFDTVLAVYTGGSLPALQQVASNDDFNWASTSQVVFFANAGTTYYIAVDGYLGRAGQIALSLDQAEAGILYETDFENFPEGLDGLDGFDGWVASETGKGTSGVFTPYGVSRAIWVGFNYTTADYVYVQRPVNFRPAPGDDGVMVFRANVAVYDSTSDTGFRRDRFGFELVNIAGDILCSVDFDNTTGEILAYEKGSGVHRTGVFFARGQARELQVTYDLKANRWSASWGTAVLFNDRTIDGSGADLSVGSVDVSWLPATPGLPGDNFVVVDDYSLSTRGLQPSITSSGEASAIVGQSFSYQITASNSPSSYGAEGLPNGLSVDAVTGLISGSPQSSGTFAVVLRATNPSGTGNKTLLLSVNGVAAEPSITSPNSAGAKVGQPFSYLVTASNSPQSFGAPNLPAGLSLDPATGLITGIPTQAGTYSIQLSASNGSGTGNAVLTLTVASESGSVSSLKLLPAFRTVKAGKEAKLMVVVGNTSTQPQTVRVRFTDNQSDITIGEEEIVLPAARSALKPKYGKRKVFVFIPSTVTSPVQISAEVVGSDLPQASSFLLIKPSR